MIKAFVSACVGSWLAGACLLVAPALMCGCGDEVGKRLPVSGMVLLDDQPLTGKQGSVLFKPDKAKGNTSPFECVGALDAQGKYTIYTKGKPGAPVGFYKVTVTVTDEKPDRRKPIPEPTIDARYASEEQSPLAVEVVAKPAAGQYDLKLEK